MTPCRAWLVQTAAVGGASLHEIDELVDPAWQPRPASLGGRLAALFARFGRALGVPIRVAPLGPCREVVSESARLVHVTMMSSDVDV